MAGVNENSNFQVGMKLKAENIIARTRPNRKALSTVDNNVIGVQKRGVLTEKNAVSHKNPALPLHRPITRKFAAQLAIKEKQLQHKEVKLPLHQTVGHQPSDCTIINAEDVKASYDHDVPMYVQYTEAMLEEIDQMDAEVEMEEIDSDEEGMDIDARDKTNPLAVTEYIDDIHAHYKKTESSSCVPPNYMSQQFDINDRMRGILIDWLIEVHYKFELVDETLYLTVNLIDRFLSLQSVGRKKLQLVGVTALLLACKYEEVSVPVVEDLVLISDRAYSRKEVLEMERLMLRTLQFNMSFPTPYVFMRRFLKSAQSDKKLENVSFFVLELSLVEYDMLRFPLSLLASAAIFTAQCTLGEGRKWSKKCEIQSGYSKEQLMECARLMVTLHRNAGTGKLTGVYKKYSTSKYGCAAKLEPAAVLEGAGL